MNKKVSILIVIDSSAESLELARILTDALSGEDTKCIKAAEFSAEMILGAELCVFGCSAPNPAEFEHLERLLKHINLTLRYAALFSPSNEAAIQYLNKIIMDCGIKSSAPPLLNSSPIAIKQWASDIINPFLSQSA
ncbi:MAG: hypothetical protein LBG79_07575 [Spirochaetaceae bacterium]|jgi:hypothetical protein|nr:hypothetical protein [Spirochaetaceae bacterium]